MRQLKLVTSCDIRVPCQVRQGALQLNMIMSHFNKACHCGALAWQRLCMTGACAARRVRRRTRNSTYAGYRRSGAHGLAQKLYNWSTLNQRVFRRLGFVVAKAECEAVALCEPGAVERVLKLVRVHIADHAERQRQQVSEPAVTAHGAASQVRSAFQSNALLRYRSALSAGAQA